MITKLFFPKIEKTHLDASAKIRDALAVISDSGSLVACVVDNNGILKGILTDSDVRKALLKGASLDENVLKWANLAPLVASYMSPEHELAILAHSSGKREIPLVDDEGRLLDIFMLGLFEIRRQPEDFDKAAKTMALANPVVILAGGKGSRLRSLVSDRPKPLAMVSTKPIIEILMDRLVFCGFQNFYISVNYMAEQIYMHFKSPKYDQLNIKFIEEPKPLGTAGSIAYVKDEIDLPFIVCNADVLTKIRFDQLIHHHQTHEAEMTCVVQPQHVSIPYGVIEVEHDRITQVREKPQINYLANAGIYVLSPSVGDFLKSGEYMDMPHLIDKCLSHNRKVVPFMLHEYWLDVGAPADYQQANKDYCIHFEK